MHQLGLVDQSRSSVVGVFLPVVAKLILEIDLDREAIPCLPGSQGNRPVTFRHFSDLEG